MTSQESSKNVLVVVLIAAIVAGGVFLTRRSGTSSHAPGVRDIRQHDVGRKDLTSLVARGSSTPPETASTTPEPSPTPTPEPTPYVLEAIEIAALQPPGSVSGWVSGAERTAIAEVPLKLEFKNLVKGGKAGPKLEAKSESNGRFEFARVPPGEWSLVADHPAYAVAKIPGLTVESGKALEGIEVKLEAALTVTGKVQTTSGKMLSGVQVVLARQIVNVARSSGEVVTVESPYRTAETDDKGAFKIERAGPGPHVLTASLQGFANERLETGLEKDAKNDFVIQMYPGASIGGLVRSDKGAPIVGAKIAFADPLDKPFKAETASKNDGSFLLGGLRAERTFRLTAKAEGFAPAGPYDVPAGRLETLIVFESGGAISGVVRSLETNAAESSIGIDLESASEGFPIERHETSAADGTFKFAHLPSGTYNVRVSNSRLTSDPRLGVKVKIPDETKGVDFLVYPGKRIAGTVSDSVTGERIAKATVKITSQVGPQYLSQKTGQTVTDAGGAFVFENLPYGFYSVTATAKGYRRYPGPEGTAEVRLLPDEDQDPIDLFLARGGNVSGLVVNAGGSTVGGAIVRLYNTPGAPSKIDTSKLEAVTDDIGHFEIDGIPLDAEVHVTASATPQGAPIPLDAQGKPTAASNAMYGLAKGKSEPIVLTEFLSTATITIRLGVGGPLTVSVEDDSAAPINDANVSISHDDFRGDKIPDAWSAKTSGMGSVLFPNIPEGAGSASASKKGYISATRRYSIQNGEPSRLTLTLQAGVSLEGYVYDDVGVPFQEGTVAATPEAGAKGGGQSPIDARGHFLIDGLGDGTFTLVANAVRQTPTGKHTVRHDMPGVDSALRTINITVPMNGSLDGLIVDKATNKPIAGSQVTITGSYATRPGKTAKFTSSATAKERPGEFTFRSIPPATYTLSASAPNYLPATVSDLKVDSPGSFWAGRIPLEQGASLKAVVVAETSGEPLSGAKLTLKPSGGAIKPPANKAPATPTPTPVPTQVPGMGPQVQQALATPPPGSIYTGQTTPKGEVRIASIIAGMYTVEITHPRFLPKTINLVQIAEKGETDLGTIELSPGGRLFGKVTDGFKKPVIGAMVTARYLGEDWKRTGRTDDSGIVKMEGLKPGVVTITVTANFKRGAVTKTLEKQISATEETTFEVELAGNLKLAGPIFSDGRGAIQSAIVDIYPMEADGTPVIAGRIRADVANAYYTAENMIEGDYLLLVTATIGARVVQWHDRTTLAYPGRNLPVSAPRGRLIGRVLSTNMTVPLPDIQIRLRSLSAPQSGIAALQSFWEWAARSDEVGYYEFENLSAGSYEIVATEAGSSNPLVLDIVHLDTANSTVTFDLIEQRGPTGPNKQRALKQKLFVARTRGASPAVTPLQSAPPAGPGGMDESQTPRRPLP